MAVNLFVKAPIINQAQKEKIDRTLLWYDEKKKEMQTFSGGMLKFEHKFDQEYGEYRLFPKVEDIEVNTSSGKIDVKSIAQWFSNYTNYNNTSVEIESLYSNGIMFSVADDEFEDFAYDLERHGFLSEIQ